MTDADRIAELEEELRQLRETFLLSEVELPPSWPLRRTERRLLSALLQRQTIAVSQYPLINPPQKSNRSNEDNIKTAVFRLRSALAVVAPGVAIRTMHRQARYYISQPHKTRLEAVIAAHLARRSAHRRLPWWWWSRRRRLASGRRLV